MEIEVIDRRDNILLERTEVHLVAKHPKTSTPSRKEIKEAVAEVLGLKKETLVIDYIDGEFGKEESRIYVKLYKDVEKARSVEEDHILKRNGLLIEKKKKEQKQPEAAPAK